LRDIRFIDVVGQTAKSETGGDSYHQAHDPLWQTDNIKLLLHRRPKRTEDERQKHKKEYLKQYYRKLMTEKEKLEKVFEEGEIDEEEYEARAAKCNIGWYKMVAETQEIAKDYSHFRTRFRDIYAQDPPSRNPLPYEWPTTASMDAYQTIVCLCTPVHHLIQVADPMTRNVQITLKIALSPDKDYLNAWIHTINENPCQQCPTRHAKL
jgi:hypothetical protein